MLQEPSNDFAFNELQLGPPTGLQGGSYFTKLLLNDNNLYLQVPKCLTKQGIVVTEKKKYCDLMFSRDAVDIIAWFENIERRAQQLLFEKKNIWFHDDLEMSDIENSFTSPIRSYKSGNYYLVRCSVPKVVTPETISCYNEREEPVSLDEINENDVQLIPIVEVQGIKFSSKNFQIEIGLRQIMVIKKKEIFKKCMIRIAKTNNEDEFSNVSIPNGDTEKEDEATVATVEEVVEEPIVEEPVVVEPVVEEPVVEEPIVVEPVVVEPVVEEPIVVEPVVVIESHIVDEPMMNEKLVNNEEHSDNNEKEITNEESETILIQQTKVNEESKSNREAIPNDLNEIDITTIQSNSEESLTLRNPSEVYYEMWKHARERAKEAKKEALTAYLEAKRIKEHYMLDVLDSDSESDIEEKEHELEVEEH